MTEPAKKPPFATTEQVAEWLQIEPDRLAKIRRRGEGPPYLRVGRQVRYAWADVHRWAERARTMGGES